MSRSPIGAAQKEAAAVVGPRARRLACAAAALAVVLASTACRPNHTATPPTRATPNTSSTPATTQPDPQTSPPPTLRPPTGTGWGPTLAEWRMARRHVAAMSAQELAGQVIVATYPGTAPPIDLVRDYHLAGVIELTDNIGTVSDLVTTNAQLQASDHRGWPLVIATDQEGGIVSRVGPPLTQFPTFMAYGAAHDPTLTQRAARASGEELRAAGFTMVYAPDADVTIGPPDPTIGSRSAGDAPPEVAAQVVAAERGYRQAGIVSVVKHFPGHGSVTTDSHEGLPVQDATLDELAGRDWVPFQAAVRDGASAVMVGHIALQAVDPGVPADLSPRVVSLLRSRLAFHGLVTTDALNMGAVTQTASSAGAAVDALNAGVDLLLMPADLQAAYDGIIAAMADGTLARSRVEDAAAKVVALMVHEQRHQVPSDAIGRHEALSQAVSAAAVTLVSGDCARPYVGSAVSPSGDRTAVAAFTTAADEAGLTVAPGGTTVALIAYGYGPASADVVVSLDTPYALTTSRAGVAELALYGSNVEAMRALVAVLTGDATAPGRLPVSFEGLHQQGGC